MDVDRYILEERTINGVERPRLMRIVFIDGVGFRGEQYSEGRWQPNQGVLSYMFDPSPADFISEEEAEEVIRQLDRADESEAQRRT